MRKKKEKEGGRRKEDSEGKQRGGKG